MPPEGGPPGTHVVHGDRSFDCHDADFVLFGVTAEEIRWQSGVVVAARDSSSFPMTPTPSSMGETRTSFTNSPMWCPGSVVCAPVVLGTFTDLCRLWALAQEGSGMSIAVRGTTCVAPGQLDVDAPSSYPACARLLRFLFVEDRTAVHEAGGSQGSGL